MLIANNPAVNLTLANHRSTDVACALLLFLAYDLDSGHTHRWLAEMIDRRIYAVKLHRCYSTALTDYRDLIEHPRERTPEYLKEATAGTTLDHVPRSFG